MTPIDDFDYFADDIMRTLEAFEEFTKATKGFVKVVSKKIKLGKNEILYNKDDRGMFG